MPLAGPETRVDRVDLDVSFDAERGDTWTGNFQISGLDRPGFSVRELTLDGEGTSVRHELTLAVRGPQLQLEVAARGGAVVGQVVTGCVSQVGCGMKQGAIKVDDDGFNRYGEIHF